MPKGHKPAKLNEEHLAKIRELVEANNSIFAREIRDALGINCALSVIYRALAKLGYTLKKELSANERNKEEIRQEREKWNNWKEGADMDRLVFLDETGVRTNFAPRYGWSLRGHPCRGETPAGWKSYSIASAIRLKGVVQSTTVEGSFKKESFREYM